MATADLYTAAGTVISYEEYLLALPDALRKLKHINTLTAINHGKEYLDQLIVETVRANRLTSFLDSARNSMPSTTT